MHWYEGSIAEAVALSKQRNAIFVVFVEGDNDLSSEMTQIIENAEVAKRLSNSGNFLAIKLRSGSENYTHFAKIYQFVPVPSLFFIGRNGTPLEVVCAGIQPANLATRIDRILEEHQKDKPKSVLPGGNIQQHTEQLLNAERAPASAPPVTTTDTRLSEDKPETSSGPPAKIQKIIHQVTKSGKEYDVICDGDVCVRVPKLGPDDAGPSTAPHSPIVMVNDYDNDSVLKGDTCLRIPKVRPDVAGPSNAPQFPFLADADKQAEENKTEAEDDASVTEKMERAKELIEARKREKAAKEKELEKQKELERRNIGQGVAELKKWQADQELKHIQEERKREKMENTLVRQRILEQIAQDRAERRARDSAPPPARPASPPARSGDGGSTRTRIQFKLPDGASHTAHFEARGTLLAVQQYVADNLQLSASNFSLWTAFPRRELTDTTATLLSLQLTPSAALLVLPRRQAATVSTPTTFSNILALFTQIFTAYILDPSQQLYQWLYSRLFPAVPPPRAEAPRPSPPRSSPQPPTPNVRRRGNIHRLGEEKPGEDDNNTWNGNSTQQM